MNNTSSNLQQTTSYCPHCMQNPINFYTISPNTLKALEPVTTGNAKLCSAIFNLIKEVESHSSEHNENTMINAYAADYLNSTVRKINALTAHIKNPCDYLSQIKDIIPIIAGYIGDDVDIFAQLNCTTANALPEEDFALYDEKLRKRLVEKFMQNCRISDLSPTEQAQLKKAKHLVQELDYVGQQIYSNFFQFFPNLSSFSISEYETLKYLPELPNTLKKFSWYDSESEPFPIKKFTKLIRGSYLEDLDLFNFSIKKFLYLPPSLKKIHFGGSGITSIDIIFNHPNLEDVTISEFIQRELPPIKAPIKKLTLESCLDLTTEGLKPLSGATKLEELIFRSSGLGTPREEEYEREEADLVSELPPLPESLKKLSIEESFCFTSAGISSLGEATGLEEICIGNCKKITALPDKLPKSLKKLTLRQFFATNEGIAALSQATNLQTLILEECYYLTSLPPLSETLKELKIKKCINISAEEIERFRKTNPTADISFTADASFFLSSDFIKSLPPLPSFIRTLRLFSVTINITQLDELSKAQGLEELEMDRCWKVTALPRLPDTLKRLKLDNLIALSKNGLDTLSQSPQLEELELSHDLEGIELSRLRSNIDLSNAVQYIKKCKLFLQNNNLRNEINLSEEVLAAFSKAENLEELEIDMHNMGTSYSWISEFSWTFLPKSLKKLSLNWWLSQKEISRIRTLYPQLLVIKTGDNIYWCGSRGVTQDLLAVNNNIHLST